MYEFRLNTKMTAGDNKINITILIDDKTSIHNTHVRLDTRYLNIQSLSDYGFSETEINGLLNITKHDSVNPITDRYEIDYIYDNLHKDAIDKFNDILHKGKKNNLSKEEQYLLKRFGKTNKQCIIREKKDIDKPFMYMFTPMHKTKSNRRETIEFVLDLIEKHFNITDEIMLDIRDSVDNKIDIHFETKYEKGYEDLYMRINKALYIQYNRNTIKGLSINAVPICEIYNANVDIDTETLFTKNLKPNLFDVNDLDKYKYRFVLYDDMHEQITKLMRIAEDSILNGEENPLSEKEIKLIGLLDNQVSIDVNDEKYYKKELVSHEPEIPENLIKELNGTYPRPISINNFCKLIKILIKDIVN